MYIFEHLDGYVIYSILLIVKNKILHVVCCVEETKKDYSGDYDEINGIVDSNLSRASKKGFQKLGDSRNARKLLIEDEV